MSVRVRLLLVVFVVSAVAGGSYLAFMRPDAHSARVSKVNAACERTQAQFDLLPHSDGTLAQALVVLPKITALSALLLSQVRAVPAASTDSAQIGALFASWDDELVNDQAAVQRLKSGDDAGFQAAINQSRIDSANEDAVMADLHATCHRGG